MQEDLLFDLLLLCFAFMLRHWVIHVEKLVCWVWGRGWSLSKLAVTINQHEPSLATTKPMLLQLATFFARGNLWAWTDSCQSSFVLGVSIPVWINLWRARRPCFGNRCLNRAARVAVFGNISANRMGFYAFSWFHWAAFLCFPVYSYVSDLWRGIFLSRAGLLGRAFSQIAYSALPLS